MKTPLFQGLAALWLIILSPLAHSEVLDKLPQATSLWLWFGGCALLMALVTALSKRRRMFWLTVTPATLPITGLVDFLMDKAVLQAAWIEAPMAYWLSLALPALAYLGLCMALYPRRGPHKPAG